MTTYTLVGRTDPGPDQRLHIRAVYGDLRPDGGIDNPSLCGNACVEMCDLTLDVGTRVAGRVGICQKCAGYWTAVAA